MGNALDATRPGSVSCPYTTRCTDPLVTLLRKASDRYADDGMESPASDRRTVPLEFIEPNPEQPRQRFDCEAEAGLAESIRRHGVLQPLVVLSLIHI